jgi:hypothetical protein
MARTMVTVYSNVTLETTRTIGLVEWVSVGSGTVISATKISVRKFSRRTLFDEGFAVASDRRLSFLPVYILL